MNIMAQYIAELVHAQFEKRKPAPIPEGLTMEVLYHLAVRNHMEYLMLGALLQAPNLPEEWIPTLKKRVMNSILCTVTQVNEVKELERRCEANGIENQPMKGARMKFIYPSPEMREMSDIDILIRGDSMSKADAELKDMGYELVQAIKHHDIYQKGAYMVIEAHKAMYDKTVDNNQYEYFCNMSRAVLREGCAYTYDFNVEDFYIYMIAHMAKHFYAMGCGIRNLLDIYVYLSARGNQMNREYVDAELEKLGLLVYTKQMEEIAFVWMNGEEGTEFHQQVFDYMLDSGIYGKDENGIWNKFAEEKMQDKEVTKASLRKWYLFPPLYYMAEYYPWLEEKPFLLPLAWCIRGFRGVFLKKGAHKRELIQDINQDEIKVYQNIYQKMQLHFK